MRRKIIWTVVILVLADLATVFAGYGIRLKEHPCTHLTGIGIAVNYVTKDCQRFRWWIGVPAPIHD
jgi:hypothetical protein